MLVDYISPERLPAFVVWIDWHIYANWESGIVSVLFLLAHYFCSTSIPHLSMGGCSIAVFCGICFWFFYLVIVEGYGVG